MRCPDCNKFVPMASDDPDVQNGPDIELDIPKPEMRDGVTEFGATVTANVRIVRSCEECGTELKGAEFDLEDTTLLPIEHADHEIEVEETGIENSERSEGKNRGTRTYYGVEFSYEILCKTCKVSLHTETIKDSIQASDMDELV